MKETLAELRIETPVDVAWVKRELAAIKSALASFQASSSKISQQFKQGFSSSFTGIRTDAQKAFSSLRTDASRALGDIAKDAQRQGRSITQALKSAFGGMGGSGIGGSIKTGMLQGVGQSLYQDVKSAFIAPFKGLGKTIADASDADTVSRKFKSVFEEATGDAESFAKDMASKLGLGITDVKATMARFQDTLVPAGFSVGEATDMTKNLTGLSADLASSEGISEAEAADRIVSGMVGNHEALRRFGVIITETSLNAKLLEMGIEGGSDAATEQQKVLARLNILMDGTRQAQGSATRNAGSFATALRGLQSMLTEVSATIGRAFMPAAGKLAEFFRDVLQKVRDNLTAVDGWGASLKTAMANVLEFLKPASDLFTGSIASIGEYFGSITKGLADATASWDTFKSVASNVFEQLKTLGFIAFNKLQTTAIEAMGAVVGAIMGAFGTAEEEIKVTLKTWVDSIADLIAGIMEIKSLIPSTKTTEEKMAELSGDEQAEVEKLVAYEMEAQKSMVTKPEMFDPISGAKNMIGSLMMPSEDTVRQRAIDVVQKESSKKKIAALKASIDGPSSVTQSGILTSMTEGAKAGVEGAKASNAFSSLQKQSEELSKQLEQLQTELGTKLEEGASINAGKASDATQDASKTDEPTSAWTGPTYSGDASLAKQRAVIGGFAGGLLPSEPIGDPMAGVHATSRAATRATEERGFASTDNGEWGGHADTMAVIEELKGIRSLLSGQKGQPVAVNVNAAIGLA